MYCLPFTSSACTYRTRGRRLKMNKTLADIEPKNPCSVCGLACNGPAFFVPNKKL